MANIQVTVNEPNINADFDQSAKVVIAGDTVAFTDKSTTDGPAIVKWEWDFGDGKSATGVATSHSYDTAGPYQVKLTVTDILGYSGSAMHSVTVSPPNLSAAFTQSAEAVIAGEKVTFIDASTTNGQAIVKWEWDFGDGKSATGVATSHSYDTVGTYSVKLTVTDALGFSNNTTHSVIVAAPNINADFDQSATAVIAGDTVAFTDTSKTNGPKIVKWEWDFGDGKSGIGKTIDHTYETAGAYQVKLTVTDDLGYSDSTTHGVTVVAPTINAAFSQSADKVIVGDSVSFTDKSTTNGPAIVKWEWDFGDGNSGTGKTISHVYDSAGTYKVTLKVTDAFGYSDTTTSTIEVEEGTHYLFLPVLFKSGN